MTNISQSTNANIDGSLRELCSELAVAFVKTGFKLTRFAAKTSFRGLIALNAFAYAASQASDQPTLAASASSFLALEREAARIVLNEAPTQIGLAFGTMRGAEYFERRMADVFDVSGNAIYQTANQAVPRIESTPYVPKRAPSP